MQALPGTLMHDRRPLMRVTGAFDDEIEAKLAKAFTIERHRSFDHDPRLGLIALSEIASRALAPATNDPGTAIEVLNALLRTLSELPPDAPRPDADLPPVYVPRPSPEEFMRDGFAAIVREGAGEEEVAIRAFKILAIIGASQPAVADTARELSDELRRNVERRNSDPTLIDRILAVHDAERGRS